MLVDSVDVDVVLAIGGGGASGWLGGRIFRLVYKKKAIKKVEPK